MAESKEWQVGKPALECHRHMLENGLACDVKFVFGNTPTSTTKELPAHKYMLICRSPVFEAMINGQFTENSNSINITDIDCEVFKEILKFMYCEECDICPENVLHVLFAAKKYFLQNLVKRCLQFLEKNMSAMNVCTIFTQCLLYGEEDLADKCLKFISDYPEEVVDSSDFVELSQDALYAMISSDQFAIDKEVNLYRACIVWANRKICDCQNGRETDITVRTTLGNCLYQIRFGSMTMDELLDDEPPLNLEEQLYFLHLVQKSKAPERNKTDMSMFNMACRNEKNCVSTNRFKEASTFKDKRWNYSCDRICFLTDKAALLRGITFYGGYQHGDRHHVMIKIRRDGNELVSKTKSEIISDGTPTPLKILLCDPVHIDPNVVYLIEADTKGPPSYFGLEGQPVVDVGGVKLIFRTHTRDHNGTSVECGQIPQLIFKWTHDFGMK